MEPAGHVNNRRVIHGPLSSAVSCGIDNDKVNCKDDRNHNEHRDTAELRAAGELVEKDQSEERHEPAEKLHARKRTINLE